eukprot:787175-Pyramimonas_sp.AAC.1
MWNSLYFAEPPGEKAIAGGACQVAGKHDWGACQLPEAIFQRLRMTFLRASGRAYGERIGKRFSGRAAASSYSFWGCRSGALERSWRSPA